MKLYNANTTKVVNTKVINNNGIYYVNKLTEAELNAHGHYKIEYQSAPSRRYHTLTPVSELSGNKYIIGYTSVYKPLIEVKAAMIKDFISAAKKYEEESLVTSSVNGLVIKGNTNAIHAFTLGAKRGFTTVRDTNYKKHTVTAPQMNTLLEELEDAAMALFMAKGDKFDEIDALTSVEACELYEATPYDYIITQEDVDNDIDGSLVLGATITKYKNKVKDWS